MTQVKWSERETEDRESRKLAYVNAGLCRMGADPELRKNSVPDAVDMLTKEFDSFNPLPAEGLSARVERLEKLVSELQKIVTGKTTL